MVHDWLPSNVSMALSNIHLLTYISISEIQEVVLRSPFVLNSWFWVQLMTSNKWGALCVCAWHWNTLSLRCLLKQEAHFVQLKREIRLGLNETQYTSVIKGKLQTYALILKDSNLSIWAQCLYELPKKMEMIKTHF